MDEVIIVKIGGGAGNQLQTVIDDLATLWQASIPWMLVHGGSDSSNEVATKLGHAPQFITSPTGYVSRRTDSKTLKILTMVLAGYINTKIVTRLQASGVNAVGLTGMDGRLLEGPWKKAIKSVQDDRIFILRDDFTGTVTNVNVDLLRVLLKNGYAPVVCPPAISYENELINVDSDRVAAAIAVALSAKTLVILTGTIGLLRDSEDPASLISRLNPTEIEYAIENYAKGRMKHKLLATLEALEGGIDRVIISSSAKKSPIYSALQGAGTLIQ